MSAFLISFTPPSHKNEKAVNFYELTFVRNILLTAAEFQGQSRTVHTTNYYSPVCFLNGAFHLKYLKQFLTVPSRTVSTKRWHNLYLMPRQEFDCHAISDQDFHQVQTQQPHTKVLRTEIKAPSTNVCINNVYAQLAYPPHIFTPSFNYFY